MCRERSGAGDRAEIERIYKSQTISVPIYVSICGRVHTHKHTHTRRHARTRACTHARTQARARAHTHTHTRMYTSVSLAQICTEDTEIDFTNSELIDSTSASLHVVRNCTEGSFTSLVQNCIECTFNYFIG